MHQTVLLSIDFVDRGERGSRARNPIPRPQIETRTSDEALFDRRCRDSRRDETVTN